MNTVPEISFKLLEKNDPDSIEILKNALSSHGFFSVIDHGLSSLLAENCYKASEKFFNLDLELKLKYHHKNLKGARGYTPNGIETAVGENVPDQKEFWHHGPIVDETYDNRVPKNLFIEELEDFNELYDDLFINLNNIGAKLLSVIAISLELKPEFFNTWVDKGNSLLRSIHYPPVKSTNNNFRARAHEDINLITLLIGAEEGGLEIQDKNNEWIKVVPSSKAIVCNIGDMMQRITDGKLKSTTHRVMNYDSSESKSRYSIPFFLHPAPNILLKSIYNEEDKGVLAHDFLDERLKAIKLY